MTTNPDQLRREIEHTQRGLSADVNALTEKVTPSRIVHRRVHRARRSLSAMKDTIMGSTSESTDRLSSTASTMGDKVSSVASTVGDNVSSAASTAGQMVTEAPQAMRRQTQGNPLAAGLIVFGLGWLTASLLPPSKREQELADHAKDLAQEHIQPAVGEMAEQLKDNLREPAEQAVESIKATAQDAGSTVADETRSAAEDIKNHAHDAKDNIKEHGNSAPRSV
ncbi:MAG TPA: DUF3618 domain-containing protein [Actinophytocola sp.]|uniref:DUF3618 domain-containing protein n=1 Tax=Actinophytocola sp. TaxID=1872138 RepID=UPI002DBBB26C|nr:DUF3618 domain-containing protein [Actinophytocola sp.]HEU5475909.1 DUF3618 domain-containing protein [Actinophytocola sp.]